MLNVLPNNKRVVSGITATGNLTLGNYLGAIKNFIELSKNNELFIFVANLHAITIPISSKELKQNIISIAALYYSCGLNLNNTTIFIQSDILEHANLGHILLCNTTIGELNRMTQFKDKSIKMRSKNGSDFIPTGLLTYPALMAADILLYDAEFVPVGKDQKQHLELTRNLAERLNNKYNLELFKIPQPYTPELGAKIMDLQEPTKKMSKSSDNPKSVIFLLDPPEVISKKIKSAVTDSENKVYYEQEKKPGISNLLTIYCAIKNISIENAVKKFENLDYGKFKNYVSDSIIDLLSPIQESYKKLINSDELNNLLLSGANKAKTIASKKLELVLKTIGLK